MTQEEINEKAIKNQKELCESNDWRGGFKSGANWAYNKTIREIYQWLELNSTTFGNEHIVKYFYWNFINKK